MSSPPSSLPDAIAHLDAATYPTSAIGNFIGGRFVGPRSGGHFASYEPATGRPWLAVPDSGPADVDEAVAAAAGAFPAWSQLSAAERGAHLHRLADAVESHSAAFARVESRDQGKPVALAAAVDIPRCVHNLRFFATAVQHQLNDSIVQRAPVPALNYTLRSAVGVAGLVTPWNLPLYLASFKLAPALACGNTAVLKCSECTPASAWLLAKAVQDAGVPPGVVNMVFGTGASAGERLVSHPDVRLVSFTGSTATGGRIQALCAPHCKKVSLELGGKNACIVFADADLDRAVPAIARSCFFNQGEICLATSRLYAHRAVFAELAGRLRAETAEWTVGDPKCAGTKLGPLVSKAHYDKVVSYIELARSEGVEFLCGDEGPIELADDCKGGYFVRPTVLLNVPARSRLMREEIFGPVVCLNAFDTDEEAVEYANDSEYGLSASVWTESARRMHNVAARIHAGTVWCNCWLVRELHMPFGGVKASGIGREGAADSVDFYTEKKCVCVALQ